MDIAEIAPEDLAGESQLRDYLAAYVPDARILAPGIPMPTVPLAAAAIGVATERIIKSVVFTAGGSDVVLAVASGTARIDRLRLAAILGVPKLKLAAAETVLAITGYRAGGVAPIGHRDPVAVVVDRRVTELPVVYGGGGSERTLLEITPSAIIRLTGAMIADIVVSEQLTS